MEEEWGLGMARSPRVGVVKNGGIVVVEVLVVGGVIILNSTTQLVEAGEEARKRKGQEVGKK